MSAGSGTQEAGEASSSTARAGVPGHPGAGQPATLPADRFAVEWWLASQAVTGAGLPYATDGVLDLWPGRRAETDRWTFGLELEFAVADAGWVATELHALGLCASPEPAPYHSPRSGGLWVVEQDRSVSTVFESPDGGAPDRRRRRGRSRPPCGTRRRRGPRWPRAGRAAPLRGGGQSQLRAARARRGGRPAPRRMAPPAPRPAALPLPAGRAGQRLLRGPVLPHGQRRGRAAPRADTSSTATAGPWSAPCSRRTRT